MDAVLEVLEKWLFLRSVGDLEAVLELSVFENCPRSGISYTTDVSVVGGATRTAA